MNDDICWIEMVSGRRFHLTAPRARDVEIEDVAHALSQVCRYAGHTRKFYSVAEHSVLCAEIALRQTLRRDVMLLALLHDAAEAYVGDLTRPLKLALPEAAKIEETIEAAILERFDLRPTDEERAAVKKIDNVLLATEARDLMANTDDWVPPEPADDSTMVVGWPPALARVRFLRLWTQVFYQPR